MTTYTLPTQQQLTALSHTIATWQPRLLEAKVTVDLLVAWAKVSEDGETVGTAIKVHGVTVYAQCSVLGIKERVAGLADARIILDGDRWNEMSEHQQYALLDHELEHIEVQYEKEAKMTPPKPGDSPQVVGEIKRVPKLDDHGRPQLKTKPHDHTFGWFDAVAERHGRHSFESKQATRFFNDQGQAYMFGDPAPKMSAAR